MLFSKEHLTEYYDWTIKPVDRLFYGLPSRRRFDGWNGSQVLFMINSVANSSVDFSIEEGNKVERQITESLPLNACSELTVFYWLTQGFTRH